MTDHDYRRVRAQMIASGGLPERRRASQSVGKVARVHVDDVIDAWGWPWGISAKELRQTLDEIDATEIELHINSPGGDCSEGVAMMNHLRDHKARVTAHIDGLAASAATVVMLGADHISASPGALVMVHDASTVAVGDAEEMTTAAMFIEKVSANIATLYAVKTGKSAEDMRALMRPKDTWLTADEAVELGLVDDTNDAAPAEQTAQAKARALALIPNLATACAVAIASQTPPAEPVDSTTSQPDQEVTVADAPDTPKVETGSPESPSTPTAPAVATAGPDHLAEITRLSTQVAQMQARDAARAKAEFFDSRTKLGKISPAERAEREADYDASPEVTMKFIDARAENSMVPASPIGHNGGLETVPNIDAELDAWASALGLPQGSIR